MTPLFVEGVGAVTPVGLNAFATCAAIRAGVSRIAEAVPRTPPAPPIKGARVKAGRALQRTPAEWLLNMAAKAISESARGLPSGSRMALLICVPDAARHHPADLQSVEVLAALRQRCGLPLHEASRVLDTGAAGLVEALESARAVLERRVVDSCIVGGVDSLVNAVDIERFARMNRLYGDDNPQGAIPGEGAVFLSLSSTGRLGEYLPLAAILGCAAAKESNDVDGPKYSTGDALSRAVESALADARIKESDIGFVVSDHNGERYSAWETTMSHARSYRTRRERLPVTYPASSVGHLGAATAALGIAVATVALARGHAPAGTGICESRSEGNLRGAYALSACAGPSAFLSPAQRRPR